MNNNRLEFDEARGSQPEWRRNYPAFRFISGNVISFFGDQIYLLAIPLIVLSLTNSPLAMGVVAFLERLPVLLQPWLGVLADRLSRKRLLLACDAGRAFIVGCTGVLFINGELMVWQLYGAAFFMGFLTQLYNTSQFAAIPYLVREQDLEKANALNTGFFQTAVFLGPGLGGVVVSLFHPGYALIINSISFIAAWCTVKSLSFPRMDASDRQKKVWEDIKEGFQYVFDRKPILYTNAAMMLSIFGTTLFLTVMVFHLKAAIGLSAASIGLLLSIGGAAAISGALLTPVLKRKWNYQQILFTASAAGGLSIAGFSFTASFTGLAVMNAIGTFAASIQTPCIITIRQKLTPSRLLGRVQATSRLISWISMPAAALLAGFLSEWTSTGTAILTGGVITTVASLIYLHPSLKTA
ncbi:MFS transporter [Halobacillus sp. A5]|uniref:MFS transporter n=1 Tax=Halobacillus sp. A5 TaxID=2880263 RepID=UPI0020A6B8DA|nr:MFS transporter [Halobacillus sp. A5]MCP3026960.1 MFS transporter [Halobacillus sp. A5]